MPDAARPLEALCSAARAALQGDANDLDVLRSLAIGLRESGAFVDAFEAGLRHMQADAGFVPRDCAPGTWTVHEDATLVATWLCEPRPRADVLLVGAADAIYVPARANAGLRVRTYRTDRPIRADVFDAEVRLRLVDECELDDVFVARAETDHGAAWQFVGEPGLVLRIALRQRRLFLWDFDPRTLAPRLIFPADILGARQRLILEFLQASGHGDVVVCAEQLLHAPEYFLRWAAMQAIVRQDPARMQEMLERGCGDSHPEIRGTSRRVLAQASG